ncbi:MAG: hypothetical protein E7050_05960 [Lentisphaerae bacterium]|nr:hypothetical protein [Lentisphaerota bacterium]
MKKFAAISMFGVLCLNFVQAAPASTEKVVEYRKVTLQNEFLSVDLLPDSMGRINQIRVLPSNYEILFPRHTVKNDFGSLVSRSKGNNFGSCDNFTYRDLRARENAMQMEQPDGRTVIFSAKNYGGEPVTLTRKITLTDSKITVTSKIQWHDRGAFTVTPRWDFFLNGGDPLPKRRGLFIPLVRMPDANGKYDRLVRWQQRTVVPSDNFLAVAIPPQKLSFALIPDPEDMGKEGKFYTLSSGYNSRWYWWMAFMLEPQKMAPGDCREYTFDIAVFPNFHDLKEICGDIAMHCYVTRSVTPWILGVVLAPSTSCDPGSVKLVLTSEADGRKYEKTVSIPPLTPGKLRNISWSLAGIPAGKYRVSGNIPGKGDFDLPEPVITIK